MSEVRDNRMEMIKSTRHQKVIGEFGEHLMCNWLSRSGFEVSRVDHTGIDLVAFHRYDKRRLGITVKSRTRIPGSETSQVNLFSAADRQRLIDACEFFACEPWIGVYVETFSYADVFLVSLQQYESKYSAINRNWATWKMRVQNIDAYLQDPSVRHIRIHFESGAWNWTDHTESRRARSDLRPHLSRLAEILPANATLTDVIYELEFMRGVEEGLADVAAGRSIPQEEVVKLFEEKYGFSLHDSN